VLFGDKIYKLRSLVRNHSGHFTCAISYQGKYVYVDDLSNTVLQFENIASLLSAYSIGWFFTVYVKSDVPYISTSLPELQVTNAERFWTRERCFLRIFCAKEIWLKKIFIVPVVIPNFNLNNL